MSSGPKKILSVIVPVRNQGAALRRLLERLASLEAPEGWGVEILAGYTPSSVPGDDTLAVLEASHVQIVDSSEIGPSAARNAAARASQGELLCFLDADARPLQDDFFDRVVATAHRLGRFGGFGGPILLDPSQSGNPIAFADHHACFFLWHARRSSGPIEFQPTVNFVMRRQVFDLLGGFDPKIRVLEDFELQQRLRRQGLQVFYDQGLPVTHEARGSLRRSWRHSWYWGLPAREAFYLKAGTEIYSRLGDPHRAWLDLPKLYFRRLRTVLAITWGLSRWRTCCCLPFLAATILVWAAAVVLGRDQPGPETAAPV